MVLWCFCTQYSAIHISFVNEESAEELLFQGCRGGPRAFNWQKCAAAEGQYFEERAPKDFLVPPHLQ
jgi:hypothetical protein